MKRKFAITLLLIAVSLLTLGCEKKPEQLMFPENIQINGRILTWDPVENASSYTVTVGGESVQTQECRLELYTQTADGGTYHIDIAANGDEVNYTVSARARIAAEFDPAVQEGMDESGYTFVLLEDKSGYEINRGVAKLDGHIVLPDFFNGYPVTRIARCMFYYAAALPDYSMETNCNTVTTGITLPAHLKEIGEYAFACMVRLEEMIIPEGVGKLENCTFLGCTHLTKVVLPQGLRSIRTSCFRDTALREIVLPDSLEYIGDNAFSKDFFKISTDGEYTYYQTIKSGLTSVIIPASVKSIGQQAFYGQLDLQEIVFEDIQNMEIIDRKALYETAWYAQQPDGIIWLGNMLYAYKGKLPADSTVEIPGNAIVCGGAFARQQNLKKVIIHTGAQLVGQGIFEECKSLSEVVIHEGLQQIPSYTFAETDSLTSITLPEGISEIGDFAFTSSGLRQIVLPASLKKVSGFSGAVTHIFCKGTPEQVKEYGPLYKIKENHYFYSETKPTEPGNYWHYVDGVPTPWEEEE